MGGREHCEPGVLDVHFHAIGKLLDMEANAASASETVLVQLEALVRQKIARRRAA